MFITVYISKLIIQSYLVIINITQAFKNVKTELYKLTKKLLSFYILALYVISLF